MEEHLLEQVTGQDERRAVLEQEGYPGGQVGEWHSVRGSFGVVWG